MSNNKPQTKTKNNSQQPKALKNKPTLKTVRQDKRALQCARIASRQPVTVKNSMRARRLNIQKSRSKKKDVNKNGLVPITTRIDPIVMEKLRQFALERGLSVSKAFALLLERSVQEKIIREQIEIIKPVIENTISEKLKEAGDVFKAVQDRILDKKITRRKN